MTIRLATSLQDFVTPHALTVSKIADVVAGCPSGLLRASLPVDFADVYLAPLIAEVARLYPGISFDFDLTPRQVDLISEPVDVVIRMGEPPALI